MSVFGYESTQSFQVPRNITQLELAYDNTVMLLCESGLCHWRKDSRLIKTYAKNKSIRKFIMPTSDQVIAPHI